MKNYLVCKNYTITDHTKWHDDRSNEKNLADNYTAMEHIMCESAKKYLVGLTDIVVHRGYANHIRDVFKRHFVKIYDLWRSEPCNILYCDLDVVFLKRAHFFNNYDFFAMFNFTDPPSTIDDHYGLQFDNFFNCGIRYYPHNMSQHIWQIGFDMLNNWDPNRWDCEQVIYNQMLWSQNIDPDRFYRPDLSFQMLNNDPLHWENTEFNRINVVDAAVVHVHGSRDSGDRLCAMQELVENTRFKNDIIMITNQLSNTTKENNMLLDKPITAGTVITVKLVSGEELLARYESDTAENLIVSKPAVLTASNTGMGMVPWVISAQGRQVKLSKSAVVAWMATDDEIARSFVQATSGITLA